MQVVQGLQGQELGLSVKYKQDGNIVVTKVKENSFMSECSVKVGMFVVSIRTATTQQEVVTEYARDVVSRIKTQKKVLSRSGEIHDGEVVLLDL